MTRRRRRRGAVLIQVAIAILVLIGDVGLRRRLRRPVGEPRPGAERRRRRRARGRDGAGVRRPRRSAGDDGQASASATAPPLANEVWSAGTRRVNSVTWACPTGVVGTLRAGGRLPQRRVRQHALPTFFGQVLGITRRVCEPRPPRRSRSGNATNCMRPFAVADKWIEQREPPPDEVRPMDEARQQRRAARPGTTSTCRRRATTVRHRVTSFRTTIGTQITLEERQPERDSEPSRPGWFLPVRLPDGNGGYVAAATTTGRDRRLHRQPGRDRRVSADRERRDGRARPARAWAI